MHSCVSVSQPLSICSCFDVFVATTDDTYQNEIMAAVSSGGGRSRGAAAAARGPATRLDVMSRARARGHKGSNILSRSSDAITFPLCDNTHDCC